MIKDDFKIIFFNGGFAGDLITALHNPDLFIKFDGRTVVSDDRVTKLKWFPYRQENTIDDKIAYLESIQELKVCSSHDVAMAYKLHRNTVLLYCSDLELHGKFYHRQRRIAEDTIMSLEDSILWQEKNKKIFQNKIDLATLRDKDFLSSIGIHDAPKSSNILNDWLKLNDNA